VRTCTRLGAHLTAVVQRDFTAAVPARNLTAAVPARNLTAVAPARTLPQSLQRVPRHARRDAEQRTGRHFLRDMAQLFL